MSFSVDATVHIVEVGAIIFWIGVTWGDLRWIKSEIRHLRDVVEFQVGIKGGKR